MKRGKREYRQEKERKVDREIAKTRNSGRGGGEFHLKVCKLVRGKVVV